MSYEYLHPRPEALKDKPLQAGEVMRLVEEEGLRPIHLRVDNATGQVFVHFERGLDRKEKERLDALINRLLREW